MEQHADPSQVMAYDGRRPQIGRGVYIAPGARVVGDVRLADDVSIWFNAVLRGDINFIEIGAGSNLQDNVTAHVDDDYPCIVGRNVVVGHAAVLHGCRVEDRCLIGIGAVLLNGVVVRAGSVVAAGAVVPQGREIPPGHIVMGVGAKLERPLPADFWEREPLGDERYRQLARRYLADAGIPPPPPPK